ADIKVPATTDQRLEKHTEEGGMTIPHPDSPEWFKKEHNEKQKEELLWSAPYDARFPQVRKQRQCFAYYVDFHRCKEFKSCKFFQNVYQDICPKDWIEKWDQLIAENRFPAKFDR
ncbi:hypothetical protein PMAYCL1PPCAC_10217, partial [Pristionchus mayeri]